MIIPQQVLDCLAGKDCILLPPPSEGTLSTPAELFVYKNVKALLMLGLALARDNAESDDQAAGLLFNPEFFDADQIHQLAQQDRLSEFVNGAGNNEKPENPTHMVSVKHADTGAPIRDILTDNPTSTQNAISRNQSPSRTVSLNPASAGAITDTLLSRIQHVGAVPNPTSEQGVEPIQPDKPQNQGYPQ